MCKFCSWATPKIFVVAFGRTSFTLRFRHQRCRPRKRLWSWEYRKYSVRSLIRLAWSALTMFKATAPVLSKASRRALTPKRGNKDFYKGGFIKRRVIAEQVVIRFHFPQARVKHTSQEVSVLEPLANMS